jgi:hypothetical protein
MSLNSGTENHYEILPRMIRGESARESSSFALPRCAFRSSVPAITVCHRSISGGKPIPDDSNVRIRVGLGRGGATLEFSVWQNSATPPASFYLTRTRGGTIGECISPIIRDGIAGDSSVRQQSAAAPPENSPSSPRSPVVPLSNFPPQR